ncbi:MAG TPA: response regulator [Chitinispirillaceae bacterium]|nr:response regulator [Chitinispirillaceae bacterium]
MKGSIILIEDLEITLELMKCFLEKAGFKNIVVFESPLAALHQIEQGLKPSVIITDYRMPEMTGVELLESVSAIYKNIPSIIITGDPGSVYDRGKYEIVEKGGIDFFYDLVKKMKQLYLKPDKFSHIQENNKVKRQKCISKN